MVLPAGLLGHLPEALLPGGLSPSPSGRPLPGAGRLSTRGVQGWMGEVRLPKRPPGGVGKRKDVYDVIEIAGKYCRYN